MKFAYFNDRFELRVGDIVYVEGKLEDLRGQGVDVTHNFRIKVSEYKRIIGKVDTSVSSNLHMAGSHFVVFTPNAIPFEKVLNRPVYLAYVFLTLPYFLPHSPIGANRSPLSSAYKCFISVNNSFFLAFDIDWCYTITVV